VSAEVLRYAAFTDTTGDRPPTPSSGVGGNPAGVVLDATRLTDHQMLAIAQAIGYSETAFVVPGEHPSDDASVVHGLRFFSPRAEVAFCGHATIATAVAIAERQGTGRLDFVTPAGPVSVSTAVVDGHLSATLTSPPAHSRPATPTQVSAALAALRWGPDELHRAYPPSVAYAGNDHLLLAAASLDRLAHLDYDYPALADLMAQQDWTTVCLFHPDDTPGTFHVRNPFPPGGVVEDPATGAAGAALGGYLRDLGLVTTPTRLTLLQGRHMGSPSRLLVDVDPAVRTVDVTGTATRLALSPYDEVEVL
jgi:PhzF family phenazine biosynthesis protein